MVTKTASSSSPLVPSPSRAVPSTIIYSEAKPGVAEDEKWHININKADETNFEKVSHPVSVYDLRGQEAQTHIDTTGFQAFTEPSSVPGEFILSSSDAEIEKVYYPEVEALIKKYTGASRVVFFDHTIRRAQAVHSTETDPAHRQPVLRAHVDQTPVSAHRRVARHVNPPQPYKRFQLINVWRPLVNTVYDYPLAVCDFNTVDVIEDLVPTTLLYPPPTPNGETYSVKFSPNHRWYYWSEMTPDDVFLLKCYDSASRALTTVKASAAEVQEDQLRDVAGVTPHTAFFDEEGAKKGIKRQSIEVRALVFYD